MRAVFRDERDAAPRGSGLTGVYHHNYHHYDDDQTQNHRYHHHHRQHHNDEQQQQQLNTPPDDDPFPGQDRFQLAAAAARRDVVGDGKVVAWMEIWDYVGGAGFRGFIVEDREGEKSAFVFFDSAVMGRDLKQALIAIMDLADGPLGSTKVVIAIDRAIPEREAKTLMKGLQWAGFSLSSLDHWAGGALDVTSSKWLFMVYED